MAETKPWSHAFAIYIVLPLLLIIIISADHNSFSDNGHFASATPEFPQKVEVQQLKVCWASSEGYDDKTMTMVMVIDNEDAIKEDDDDNLNYNDDNVIDGVHLWTGRGGNGDDGDD